jgi:hypothetical protein
MSTLCGTAFAEHIAGTVNDPDPLKYSQSLVSNDCQYVSAGGVDSSSEAVLICLDIETHLPAAGSQANINMAFSTLKGNSGPLGEAAVHWVIENDCATYHKPNNHPQENAFQYVLWGNRQ